MAAPFPLRITIVALSAAALAAACGARSELSSTTSTTTTTTTVSPDAGTAGGPPCSDSPSPECADCDGNPVPAECQGTTWVCPAFDCVCAVAKWQKTASGGGHQSGTALAVGADGSIVLGGAFGGSIGLGGAVYSSSEPDQNEVDAVLARWLPDGTHVWTRPFGAEKDDFIDDVAVTPSGEIVVIGTYFTGQSLDGLALPGGPEKKMFVARLSKDGQFIQADAFVGGANGTQGRIDALADSGVVIAGDTTGTLTWSGGTLMGSNQRDPIVVRLDASGKTVWARRFAGAGNAFATDVAAAPDGSFFVTGAFRDAIDFGLGPHSSHGDFDAFLIQLDASGTVVASTTFGGPGADVGQSVIVDAQGNVVIMASYQDGADFGAGPLSASDEAGVVASYTPAGALRWQAPFTGVSSAISGADRFLLARGSGDQLFLAGQFKGGLDLGQESLGSAIDYDVMIARLSSTGQVLGACGYGGNLADFVGGLAVDPMTGDPIMTGDYFGSIDFGLGKMANGPGGDMFVVRLPADGVQ